MTDEKEQPTRRASAKIEAPDHMFIWEAPARGYQMYLARLKKGGKSGISELFGSAEDVFSGTVEMEPVPRLDTTNLQPESMDETKQRAAWFAQSVRKQCADFLREHVWSCQDGNFGKETQKQATAFDSDETFSAAVKHLCCVTVYLTALEQGALEKDAKWLQDFLGGSMSILDRMLVGPSVGQIMQKYDFFEVPKVCQRAASHVGEMLGFGLVGDSAWNAVREFLLASGQERRSSLQAALERPPQRDPAT
ncbi:MAG TPA: hypothetical protein V6D08_05535 [Candidatus Obscuribacterales bacterium]